MEIKKEEICIEDLDCLDSNNKYILEHKFCNFIKNLLFLDVKFKDNIIVQDIILLSNNNFISIIKQYTIFHSFRYNIKTKQINFINNDFKENKDTIDFMQELIISDFSKKIRYYFSKNL